MRGLSLPLPARPVVTQAVDGYDPERHGAGVNVHPHSTIDRIPFGVEARNRLPSPTDPAYRQWAGVERTDAAMGCARRHLEPEREDRANRLHKASERAGQASDRPPSSIPRPERSRRSDPPAPRPPGMSSLPHSRTRIRIPAANRLPRGFGHRRSLRRGTTRHQLVGCPNGTPDDAVVPPLGIVRNFGGRSRSWRRASGSASANPSRAASADQPVSSSAQGAVAPAPWRKTTRGAPAWKREPAEYSRRKPPLSSAICFTESFYTERNPRKAGGREKLAKVYRPFLTPSWRSRV